MPTSSLKFRWLNRKGVLEAKSGSDVRQFLEIFGGPSAFSPVPTTLVRMFALGGSAGIRDLILDWLDLTSVLTQARSRVRVSDSFLVSNTVKAKSLN